MREGEVFVTGRLKDMLIVRGRTCTRKTWKTLEREVQALRKGRVAVFAVEHQGEEGIGVAVEISRSVQKATTPGADQHPAPGHRRCLPPGAGGGAAQPGALPKTSSGKLQRSACRVRMAEDSLDCYAHSPSRAPLLPPRHQAMPCRRASRRCGATPSRCRQ